MRQRLIIEGGEQKLLELLQHQLNSLFVFYDARELQNLPNNVSSSLEQLERCFQCQDQKYYVKDDRPYFNPLHTAQYGIFLYCLSNSVWKSGDTSLANKIYALNKMLHAFDLFYEVEMPEVWSCDHPVGSVIGRAKIGDGFFFMQNCTVGNNHGRYPEIGRNVRMMAGSTIIGSAKIGNDVIISAQCYVKDMDVPDNNIVFGQSPNLTFKRRKMS